MSDPERRPKADTFHAEQFPYPAKQSDMDPSPTATCRTAARRPSCSSTLRRNAEALDTCRDGGSTLGGVADGVAQNQVLAALGFDDRAGRLRIVDDDARLRLVSVPMIAETLKIRPQAASAR